MYALLGVIVLEPRAGRPLVGRACGDAIDQPRPRENRRQRRRRDCGRESRLAADPLAAARRTCCRAGAWSTIRPTCRSPAGGCNSSRFAAGAAKRSATSSSATAAATTSSARWSPRRATCSASIAATACLSEPSFVLVYPEVIPLEGFDIASRRPIGEVRMSHRLFEDPTRIAGVRGYQSGDPLNRIHWRATARTGALHSKIYEPSTVAGATILLDFHEQSFDRAGRAGAVGAGRHRGRVARRGAVRDGPAGGLHHQRPRRRRPHPHARAGGHDQLRTRQRGPGRRHAAERSHRLRPVIVPTRRSNIQLRQILETLGPRREDPTA